MISRLSIPLLVALFQRPTYNNGTILLFLICFSPLLFFNPPSISLNKTNRAYGQLSTTGLLLSIPLYSFSSISIPLPLPHSLHPFNRDNIQPSPTSAPLSSVYLLSPIPHLFYYSLLLHYDLSRVVTAVNDTATDPSSPLLFFCPPLRLPLAISGPTPETTACVFLM